MRCLPQVRDYMRAARFVRVHRAVCMYWARRVAGDDFAFAVAAWTLGEGGHRQYYGWEWRVENDRGIANPRVFVEGYGG